jgi:acylglycerol lipase
VKIWWQAWLASEPQSTMVLAHGAGEHSSRYGHVGKALRERGHSVWALDHRGHGRSDGHRALIDRLDKAVADIHALVGIAAEERGEHPVLFGHSMGGLLATAYALRNQDSIRALALTSPAVALAAASPFELVVSRLLTRVIPTLGVFQVDPADVSRDPDVVRDYETDPQVFHGKLPVRTVTELAGEIGRLEEAVPSITLPVLLMYGAADRIVPTAGSEMLRDRLGSKDLTVTPYEGLYHEILNEPERDQVIAQLADWLDSHSQ